MKTSYCHQHEHLPAHIISVARSSKLLLCSFSLNSQTCWRYQTVKLNPAKLMSRFKDMTVECAVSLGASLKKYLEEMCPRCAGSSSVTLSFQDGQPELHQELLLQPLQQRWTQLLSEHLRGCSGVHQPGEAAGLCECHTFTQEEDACCLFLSSG